MKITPIQGYHFELSKEEKDAVKVIGSIDCSQASECEGCPFNFTIACLRIYIKNVAIKEGLVDENN